MLDEASRLRLEEMDIDVYVLRGVHATAVVDHAGVVPRASESRARVALIARTEGAAVSARALLAEVARALTMARIDAVIATDLARAGETAGIVVFGAALARDLGTALQAGRRKPVEWVGAAELADIGGSASAKRALWVELKRLVRALAKSGQPG